MDKVYAGAYATIVASAGPDAGYGLPGVGKTHRACSPSAVTGRGRGVVKLYSSLPPRELAVQESRWSTRGWTYQEAVLSPRCLYFTVHQIYFVCGTNESCEALVHPYKPPPPHEGYARNSFSNFKIPSRSPEGKLPARVWPMSKLAYHLSQYSMRQLSFEEDRLSAFCGLLSRSGLYSHYGVPFFPWTVSGLMETPEDINLAFARGLYWRPANHALKVQSRHKRHPCFPSWSWAGWGVEISCRSLAVPDGDSIDDIRCGTNFMIEWREREYDGEEAPLNLYTLAGPHPRSSNKILPELSPYLVIDAKVFQFRFNLGPVVQGVQDNYLVCSCHPNSVHPRELEFGHPLAHPLFHFPELSSDKTDMKNDKFCTTGWDCVLLYEMHVSAEQSSWQVQELLIVEWNQDIAYRVGTLTMRAPATVMMQLPWTRRRICLG
ncbi:hypothetical protein V8F20_009961 [Naviculisporaceae sp. PSN 640]